MTIFQLLMLGASAFFAFKIYEHIQTLKDSDFQEDADNNLPERSAEAFSTFDSSDLIEKADEARESGDLQKAMAIYSEANIKEPSSAETLFKMGYTLVLQDRNDEALDYYKESLAIDSDNPFAHQALASLYRKEHEYASAKMHLNASLAIDNEDKTTYYNYGNLLVDMKSFDEAKFMYEKAIELDPDFEEAKKELEKILKEA